MKSTANQNKRKTSIGKKIKYFLIISFVTVIVFLVAAEILLSLINPQPYQYPTLKFSEKYKRIYHSNVTIKDHNPPETRYYSTDDMGFRQSSSTISKENNKPNIVLLGDSFTFGIGVNDGFEFASVLADKLKQDYNVINLGIGGWGLTQEIRVYYELGQSYNPEIAIIIFCNNDPSDNLLDDVTRINNGEFEFIDSNDASSGTLSKISKLLSRSIIQKSNLYNSIRNYLYLRHHANAIEQINNPEIKTSEIPESEKFYCELLDVFANDLKQKDIKLMFTSINYLKDGKIESELHDFPFIEKHIFELDSLGIIDFVNINKWFNEEDMLPSPVGHYDKRWNFVLGDNLADYILSNN
ncbi:MAG: SGNH/GDSL hydrolase family protein [Bacteroidales bacterium]|nr:SGNH/GDSL hydrolase family protein [Bacteroidales bacterium]